MSINQFAKISPIVDSNGYLYNLNQDGKIDGAKASDTRLKPNEIGIIYNEDVLATIYDNKLVRLGVATYDNESLKTMLKNNDGSLDGKLIVLQNNSNYYLGIINGKSVKCPEFNVVHAAVFTVTDDDTTYKDSYIGYLPYKVLRITVKINDNITAPSGGNFGGNILITATNTSTVEIASVQYRDIIYTNKNGDTISHELLECQNIFKDFAGQINVNTDSETRDKNIQVCIEYMIQGDNLETVEVNT